MRSLPQSESVIFFDDGGVINDNQARAPQWQKLIAEYFIPKYGGTFLQWKDANLKVLFEEIEFFDSLLANNIYFDFNKYLDDADEQWIALMFANLDIPILIEINVLISLGLLSRGLFLKSIPHIKG